MEVFFIDRGPTLTYLPDPKPNVYKYVPQNKENFPFAVLKINFFSCPDVLLLLSRDRDDPCCTAASERAKDDSYPPGDRHSRGKR